MGTKFSDYVVGLRIKSIQRGVIQINNSNTSASVAITAVDTTKARLKFCGLSIITAGASSFQEFPYLTLDNATTITAHCNVGVNHNPQVSWELVEYY